MENFDGVVKLGGLEQLSLKDLVGLKLPKIWNLKFHEIKGISYNFVAYKEANVPSTRQPSYASDPSRFLSHRYRAEHHWATGCTFLIDAW